MFSTRKIVKISEFLKNLENCSTLWKNFQAESCRTANTLLVSLCCCLLAFCSVTTAQAQDICGYSNPEYSIYNRLLRVDVNRDGKKVGEVHFSYQFDGYYVRCVTGGVPKKRFFARARDARWAACGSCY